jgi:hypothetical protein
MTKEVRGKQVCPHSECSKGTNQQKIAVFREVAWFSEKVCGACRLRHDRQAAKNSNAGSSIPEDFTKQKDGQQGDGEAQSGSFLSAILGHSDQAGIVFFFT